MDIIDARGLSCPEPVIMLKNAMTGGENKYVIMVDNHAAKENTSRFGHHQGYAVSVEGKGGDYTITFTK